MTEDKHVKGNSGYACLARVLPLNFAFVCPKEPLKEHNVLACFIDELLPAG